MLNKILNKILSVSISVSFAYSPTGVDSLVQPISQSTMSIKPMRKQQVVFFPARFQQPVPSEMYGNFISSMRTNYDIHIAGKNSQDNCGLLQRLHIEGDEFDKIALISHSSGVADLWDVYQSNPEINIGKVVLIEPLDLRKAAISVPSTSLNDALTLENINDKIEELVETNYLELFKDNLFSFGGLFSRKNGGDGGGGVSGGVDEGMGGESFSRRIRSKLLVIKHKISDKWRFVPTIPPLSKLNFDLVDFEKSMDKEEVVIDKFSHFDILDRPWANLMNRASLGDTKNQEDLDEYLGILNKVVCDFYDK